MDGRRRTACRVHKYGRGTSAASLVAARAAWHSLGRPWAYGAKQALPAPLASFFGLWGWAQPDVRAGFWD